MASDGQVVIKSQDLMFEYVIGDIDPLISIGESVLEYDGLQ